jgi:hypothetical protein
MGRGGGAEENRPDKGPRWWRQVDLIDDWPSSQSRGPKKFYKENKKSTDVGRNGRHQKNKAAQHHGRHH